MELVHRLLQGPWLVLRSAYLLPDAQVAKTPEFTIIIMDLNWVLFAYSQLAEFPDLFHALLQTA